MLRDIIVDISDHRSACVMDYDLLEYHEGRIIPLDKRIKALEGVRGMDGREIELKKNYFPPLEEGGTPAEGQEEAVIWRLKPRNEADPQEWHLLVFLREIKGDEGIQGPVGPEGPAGHDGSGIVLRGTVETVNDLYTLGAVRDGYAYLVIATKEVYVFTGAMSEVADPTKWKNMGPVAGIKGDKGDRGPQGAQGARGEKGSEGGISSFLLNWIVSTATSSAISGVMMEVNTTLNDAINDMAMELGNLAEDAAQSAIDKALDEMMDQFKGDKGEKGDKGKDGKDGKAGAACTILGHKETEFELFPITGKAGDAWLVGAENNLYVWTPREAAGVDLGTWTNVGKVKGDKGDQGDGANWNIQLIDDKEALVGSVIEIRPTEGETPNLVIKGGDGLVVSKSLGVVKGFEIKSKYPMPTLVPTGSALPSTVDKFLTNNGTKLEWVDISIDDEPKEVIRMKSPNNKVWNLKVGNDGRLEVTEEVAP